MRYYKFSTAVRGLVLAEAELPEPGPDATLPKSCFEFKRPWPADRGENA